MLSLLENRNQWAKSQKILFDNYVKPAGDPTPESWQLKCREINPDKVQHLSAIFRPQALPFERDEGQAL